MTIYFKTRRELLLECARLKIENTAFRSVLNWYAVTETWRKHCTSPKGAAKRRFDPSLATRDRGSRAREVLAVYGYGHRFPRLVALVRKGRHLRARIAGWFERKPRQAPLVIERSSDFADMPLRDSINTDTE